VTRRTRPRAPLAAPVFVCLVAAFAILAFSSPALADHSTRELLSTGPNGGNAANAAYFDGVSADGTRTFFETDEKLVSGDTDNAYDIYERAGATTTLVSTGPAGGNGASDAAFDDASSDGSRVFFETDEKLVSSDTDSQYDIYERSGGATTLVSSGPSGGNGAFDAFFVGSSADGTEVFFESDERIVGADTDSAQDVYVRSGGTISLVTTGPAGGNGPYVASYAGSTPDGAEVFFHTQEPLTSDDTDTTQDVYGRTNGVTAQVSVGPSGGNGFVAAFFDGVSADGARVFFHTAESLEPADTDTQTDVYERSGGTATLVSRGSTGNGSASANFDGASSDGARVFFHTVDSFDPADSDAQTDIYERAGGTTSLVSTGPSGGNGATPASFDHVSADGSRVTFDTLESLVPGDTDAMEDLYQRAGGTTSQLSTGPNGGNAIVPAYFDGASNDGVRVFFDTQEPLVPADSDAQADVYERFAGTTTLLSAGGNGAIGAFYDGASEDGRRVFFDTRESLLPADTDTARDVYSTSVAQGYPRPQAAAALRVPLVIAYNECAASAANKTHGPSLAAQSCSPATRTSPRVTVGTLDSNGATTKFSGFVKLNAVPGNSGTSTDEADVKIDVSATDVRNTGGLGDYTGQLQLAFSLRITDRQNGSVPVDPATTADIGFAATVPCTTTTDTTTGSTCAVSTSADAVQPGAVAEGKRSNWELSRIELLDGGGDNQAATPDNAVFARAGVFLP
jgi:hypothetical protein